MYDIRSGAGGKLIQNLGNVDDGFIRYALFLAAEHLKASYTLHRINRVTSILKKNSFGTPLFQYHK